MTKGLWGNSCDTELWLGVYCRFGDKACFAKLVDVDVMLMVCVWIRSLDRK